MKAQHIEISYRLSPMQEGMLFHNLYARETGVDIEQIVCDLHEALNVTAFERAWQRVVERHAVLRTSFRWEGLDEPVQEVHSWVTVPLQQQDWRGLSDGLKETRLDEYLKADRRLGFDAMKAPLLRLALFRLSDAGYKFIWTFHHSLLDGRSFPLVLKEVFAFYEALCLDRDIELEEPRPYRDYIEWLQKQNLSKAEAFWRQALKGFRAATPLRLSNLPAQPLSQEESTADQAVGHGEKETRLSVALTSALQSLAREHDLTLNTVVQGAWAILLSRYSGEEDVVFGATRACRRTAVVGAESMVGVFINTLPMRVHLPPEELVVRLFKEIRAQHVALRQYEHTPLVKVQRWSELPGGVPLFNSVVVFENYVLNSLLQSEGGLWKNREFRLLEQTNYPLTVYAHAEPGLLLRLAYDRQLLDDATVGRMLGHLETLLEGIAANPHQRLSELPILTEAERHQLLVEWNENAIDYSENQCIHELFEVPVTGSPDGVAVVFEDKQLTYSELNARANQLAHYLRSVGVGPDVLVGICVERSLEMIVGLLGILKAGGAYLPLDPAYPQERLAFMLADSQAPVVLTQQELIEDLPQHDARVVCLDSDWDIITRESEANLDSGVKANNLAYVIYTSGSTGKPKGVMVEHRNVVNFFTGMDRCIGGDHPGTWLAVTSISFDISVLELFWTLTRGFKVVLHSDRERALTPAGTPSQLTDNRMEFSLFYFASDDGDAGGDKYRLLLEGAKFADKHGFSAVWTPERHFHGFGGLYPNPSVTSAAVAAVTERIQIRAGSVVMPLHSPIRVAEEWAVVDNLSKGRVGISFASGWHDRDFVFIPDNYAGRKQVMYDGIETVRRLWRGESITCRGGAGTDVEVKIFPKPVQRELPIWVTAAGGPATFRAAGELGANLLTHLLFQSMDEVAERIALYRHAWREAGHGPGDGHVTLMLHTFLGEDPDTVRNKVRKPFCEYLRSSVDLIKQLAVGMGQDIEPGDLRGDDLDALLSHAFDRYFEASGLFGPPRSCLDMIDRLKSIGVNEVACLIDFGVDAESVIASLSLLDRLKERSNSGTRSSPKYSLAEEIKRHKVTHLQCTPSMARMLTIDSEALETLSSIRKLLLGGEVVSQPLVEQLRKAVSGEIYNMYGPTETTIWSTTHLVADSSTTIPIGRPIANTQIYILDRHLQPVPIGVAGELFIGGAGVVRGYLRRPELDAEKFVAYPFVDDPESRLYRTGDLARYLPDGKIEFLGRLDYQVKVRGFRIELGEIEAALGQHPLVHEVAVLAREDVPDDKRLVAYIVPRQDQAVAPGELRAYLKKRLPDHMVPSSVVTLSEFPLTPNGKVDRKALPAPDRSRKDIDTIYTAPQNELERMISTVWQEVLNAKEVGTHDNFFDLGGNSFLMVRANNRLRELLSIDIPLVEMFRYPTISCLSGHLSRGLSGRSPLQQSFDRAQTRKHLMTRRRQLKESDRARTLRSSA